MVIQQHVDVAAAGGRLVDQVRTAGLGQPPAQALAVACYRGRAGVLLAVQVEHHAPGIAGLVIGSHGGRQFRAVAELALPRAAEVPLVALDPDPATGRDRGCEQPPQLVGGRRVGAVIYSRLSEGIAIVDDANLLLRGMAGELLGLRNFR